MNNKKVCNKTKKLDIEFGNKVINCIINYSLLYLAIFQFSLWFISSALQERSNSADFWYCI